jgi:hypothetical protein
MRSVEFLLPPFQFQIPDHIANTDVMRIGIWIWDWHTSILWTGPVMLCLWGK